MIIKIRNFGPIREYTFDIRKDMHLIFGGNSVGKSYAITVVYLIIKSFLDNQDAYLDYLLRFKPNYLPEKINYKDIVTDQDVIKKDVLTILKNYIEETLISRLTNSLVATFYLMENLQNQFTNDKLEIEFNVRGLKVCIGIDDNRLYVSGIELLNQIEVKRIKANRHCRRDKDKIVLYYVEGNLQLFNAHVMELSVLLYSFLSSGIRDHIGAVYFLPASRSGLYQALSAFGPIFAELSKNRAYLSKKIELPGISEPLSDYFISLSEIGFSRRGLAASKFNAIASLIEDEVLHGRVEYDAKTKKIMFLPNNTNLKLDLASTSSMVSELSPIVSFIRYILRRSDRRSRYHIQESRNGAKPLVFIEEPEAHLHPENQAKIMSIFARLVENDVKIIVTSHSNYMFNKANNLILEGKISVDRLQASIFKNTENGSVGENIETDNLGIADENFLDVAEELYREKMSLIERLNEND
ncbi:AAA family ATPase [Desulfolutivibrio sulfoxidireducens]|uniref:AAA family ATPase n=1 Tax=Desulfolutivibrio sulfoxidireducens TaxID=2773299 RepID=UPI00159E6EFE|nr:AAA family ATPase [Desulfolutivibrio sulfoxidireducens]QLA17633.1 AAA family ATPase [Desulfolutivibrio sulfoxidireducens]